MSQREHTRAFRAHQRQESRHVQVDANRSILFDVPWFDQAFVNTRMLNRHCKLAALEFHSCTSCLERFPNLTMAACSTECSRCSRGTEIPKLYSQVNNMDPGPVPPQLQVYSDPCTCLVLIRPGHLCNVHYLESDYSPDQFRVVYY